LHGKVDGGFSVSPSLHDKTIHSVSGKTSSKDKL